MATSIILSSALLLFLGKMLACGILGCVILGLLHMAIDIRMNPEGWKLGKEFNDIADDDENDKELSLQKVPIRNLSNRWSRHR